MKIFVFIMVIIMVTPVILQAINNSVLAVKYKDSYHVSLQAESCGEYSEETSLNILCQSSSSQVQGNLNSVNVIGTMTNPNITPFPQKGDNIHVVWGDNTEGEGFNFDTLYKNSRDGGETFDSSRNLSNDPLGSTVPQVAASGNDVHVVWQSDLLGGDILYKRSTDGGKNFGPTINLSDDLISRSPDIAISGDNVYVVWIDVDPLGGPSQLSYRRSTDGGVNFDPAVDLSSGEPRPSTSIAAFGDNVYIVWREIINVNNDEIFFRKSTDNGQVFELPINLSNDPSDSITPDVSAFNNNVYVVWDDDNPGSDEIFFRKSTDSGVSFDPPVNISNSPDESDDPNITAASDNYVYVVWEDDDPIDPLVRDIFFRKSTNAGVNFDPTINLSNNNQFSSNSDVAASGLDVYIVWKDFVGNQEIFFVKSTDNGETFDPSINLSNNDGGSDLPSIAVS